ncbi:sugar transferase [Luteolibacter yonseiensis]|uniref:Sugar transferase n=1 Tax=Luteolibacter yonseiensis TaxID=1144680 RepID=A0A934V8S2_9BACT|nr:sugar transferase [Luteolibacter yonseiensis]MBK1814418.1 sugar transferase [Luteolibacter yonseiensis]
MAISRKDSFTIQALQLSDALLVWLAFWLGGIARVWLGWANDDEAVLQSMNWALYIAVPFTPLVIERFGFYDHLRHKGTSTALWQLIRGLLVIALIMGLFVVFAQIAGTRRLVLGLGLSLSFLLLIVRDRVTHVWLKKRIASDYNKERIVLAGSGDEMTELLAELDPEITSSWKVVDHFDLGKRDVLELFALLKEQSVSRVVFSAKNTEFEKVARAVEACELQGVEAWIAASFIRTQIARPVFDAIGNKPMLVLRSTPELSWELLCKEVFDRVGAAMILAACSGFWLFAMLGIMLKSPGAPVFFPQMRAGRYGKPFRMWKFRTMVPDADKMLDQIKADHGNQMEGPVFKLQNDPRIFPFGAFLRKYSIDELPQLVNVLKGDMSLVGPRPLPIYEVDAFGDISHRRRLSVKPGITCEWQAGGRNTITSFEEWVAMDLRYIDNWSLWLDIKILLRTIPAVFFGKGAA